MFAITIPSGNSMSAPSIIGTLSVSTGISPAFCESVKPSASILSSTPSTITDVCPLSVTETLIFMRYSSSIPAFALFLSSSSRSHSSSISSTASCCNACRSSRERPRISSLTTGWQMQWQLILSSGGNDGSRGYIHSYVPPSAPTSSKGSFTGTLWPSMSTWFCRGSFLYSPVCFHIFSSTAGDCMNASCCATLCALKTSVTDTLRAL
ncbi:hypothetical protein 2016_scaffold57_00085 [Bacteriophage sp.]|nr:hypothetical protein 2016_scaffold57_00085 [Bacteriophage sp.]